MATDIERLAKFVYHIHKKLAVCLISDLTSATDAYYVPNSRLQEYIEEVEELRLAFGIADDEPLMPHPVIHRRP